MPPCNARYATFDEIEAWDSLLTQNPLPHILQSKTWADFKQTHQWMPLFLIVENGDTKTPVLALKRQLPLIGKTIIYVPKGPAFDPSSPKIKDQSEALLSFLKTDVAKKHKAILIKVETEFPLAQTELADVFAHAGFNRSASNPNFRRTMWIDISIPEEAVLDSFKPKTRYNIRLAGKKGVKVMARHSPEDIELFYTLHSQTGLRQHFPVRSLPYYLELWNKLFDRNQAELFMAYHDQQCLGGVLIWSFGGRAYYQYGASTDFSPELMPNYLLQWEAMRWAKQHGNRVYDMVGLPQTDDPKDPFAGVQRFKQGFQGQELDFWGAFDYFPSPILGRLWPKLERYVKAFLWKTKKEVLY